MAVALAAFIVLALGASSADAAKLPVGKYLSCYQTYSDSSSQSGYSSVFKASLTLKRSGARYQVGYGGLNKNASSDHATWSYSRSSLHFHRGFFDSSAGWRVIGRYAAHGAQMPHSQLTTAKYTVVLRSRGAPANDSAPPKSEGTDFQQSSFFYCTTGKPTVRTQGNGTTTGTSPGSSTTSGPHPPYGTYKCADKYGYPQDTVYLTDPFKYSEPNTVEGSFTYDESTSRIDFQGGKFDDGTTGWHFYGTYQSPNTIVLASKTQTTYGGPDADESGDHTFWHCTLQ